MRAKKKKKPTKRDNQTQHFKQRFLARYGIDPNNETRRWMLEQIQSGQCRHIAHQSNRVSVWDLAYKGNHYPVVYDRKRKSLVTVLPQECLSADKIQFHLETECDERF